MTIPVPTPDAPRPITEPPAELVKNLKDLMPFIESLTQLAERDEAGNEESKQLSAGSADFLRNLFPHLDDLTLAAFVAYVAINLAGAVQDAGLCPDVLKPAIVFAEVSKQLAWSLGTPDGQEVTR
jgi:hypothetical protein